MINMLDNKLTRYCPDELYSQIDYNIIYDHINNFDKFIEFRRFDIENKIQKDVFNRSVYDDIAYIVGHVVGNIKTNRKSCGRSGGELHKSIFGLLRSLFVEYKTPNSGVISAECMMTPLFPCLIGDTSKRKFKTGRNPGSIIPDLIITKDKRTPFAIEIGNWRHNNLMNQYNMPVLHIEFPTIAEWRWTLHGELENQRHYKWIKAYIKRIQNIVMYLYDKYIDKYRNGDYNE